MRFLIQPQSSLLRAALRAFYGAIVLLASYLTYFAEYDRPKVFWDEIYHIPAAEKYLNGVFFMEIHPPLGRLLVAAGEALLHPNPPEIVESLLTVEKPERLPDKFSFKGVRLFPAVLAWWSCLLFFLIAELICRNLHAAFLLSAPIAFDNGLIVHNIGAMREGSLVFFALLAILFFLYRLRSNRDTTLSQYALGGAITVLPFCVKIEGGLFLLLMPALYLIENFAGHVLSFRKFIAQILKGILPLGCAAVTALGVFFALWGLHCALGKRIVADQSYGASYEYQEALARGDAPSLTYFPLYLQDSFHYLVTYDLGVPASDFTNPKELGSPPAHWPLGGTALTYRWEKTPSGEVRTRALVPNPVGWGLAFVSVLLGLVLVVARLLFDAPVKDARLFWALTLFVGMYFGFLVALSLPERAFYLYHYLVPLVVAYTACVAVMTHIFSAELQRGDPVLFISLLACAIAVILAFQFFSPFTYEQPLGTAEFIRRQWLDLWHLQLIL